VKGKCPIKGGEVKGKCSLKGRGKKKEVPHPEGEVEGKYPFKREEIISSPPLTGGVGGG